MKNTLVFIAASLLLSGAYAQGQSQEPAPQSDSRPQLVAESLKSARPRGVVHISEGSTAEGSGSGVMTFDKAETLGSASPMPVRHDPTSSPCKEGRQSNLDLISVHDSRRG